MKKKTLSVILSFRNEEENLHKLIERLYICVKNIPIEIEIIFVNDCSNDNSSKVITEIKNKYQSFKFQIMTTIKRIGVTEGVILGLKNTNSDAAVFLDSDLQDPPELIPKLIDKWQEGNLIVHTVRIKRKKEPIFKKLLSLIAYKIINKFSNSLENAGDFKLIDRKIIDYIISLDNDSLYLRGELSILEVKNAKVFYEREGRFSGQSHYSLLKSLNPYHELLKGIYFNSHKKIITVVFIANILLSSIIPLLVLFHKNINFFEITLIIIFNFVIYILIGILFALKNNKETINKNFYYHD